MPTVKKSLGMRPVLDEDQLRYFADGTDFCFFWDDFERVRDWRAIRAEILKEWIATRPGRRPFFWWKVDAPGPRLRVGGRGDLIPAYAIPENLRFGIFRKSAFVDERLLAAVAPVGAELTPFDPADPPRFESQAAYLDRHKLLSAAERKALPPDALEPEVIA
jgi:hypothetical protein